MLWQTVPNMGNSNREGPITDSGQPCTTLSRHSAIVRKQIESVFLSMKSARYWNDYPSSFSSMSVPSVLRCFWLWLGNIKSIQLLQQWDNRILLEPILTQSFLLLSRQCRGTLWQPHASPPMLHVSIARCSLHNAPTTTTAVFCNIIEPKLSKSSSSSVVFHSATEGYNGRQCLSIQTTCLNLCHCPQ